MYRLAAYVGPQIPLETLSQRLNIPCCFKVRTPMNLKCLPMEMALVSRGMVQILNQAFIEIVCQPNLMKIS